MKYQSIPLRRNFWSQTEWRYYESAINQLLLLCNSFSLREKCPHLELFSCIRTRKLRILTLFTQCFFCNLVLHLSLSCLKYDSHFILLPDTSHCWTSVKAWGGIDIHDISPCHTEIISHIGKIMKTDMNPKYYLENQRI